MGSPKKNTNEKKLHDPIAQITALELIDRCIDDPDCARNLEVFDGIRILLKNALSDYTDVSSRCCEILSLMLANNDKLQLSAVNKHRALDILVLGAKASEIEAQKNAGEGSAKPLSLKEENKKVQKMHGTVF